MNTEIKNVFLYILGFGISDLIMEQMGIQSLTKKMIYFSIVFFIYYHL